MSDAIIKRLIEAYRAELLANPPVRGLEKWNQAREGMAWGIARKDVTRLLAALQAAGLEIVESA